MEADVPELIPVRTKADSPTKVCVETNCGRPLRARGLCAFHWKRKHGKPDRKVQVPCTHCGTLVEKVPHSKYTKRFCSYICRDLWRIETGINPSPVRPGRQDLPPQRKCAIPADHPSRWIGSVCRVPWSGCEDCGTSIIKRPPRRLCTACAAARRYARRSSRWTRRRTAIFERDGWICWLCGQTVDSSLRVPHPLAATVDHVLPVNHGGDDADDNLACAHLRCNSSRGDSLVRLDGRHAA